MNRRRAPFSIAVSFAAALLVATGAHAQAEATSRPAYRQVEGVKTGSIAIRVIFEGDAPASRPIQISDGFRRRAPKDSALCDACAARGAFNDESLVVDAATKGVRDVAVSLREVSEGARPPLPRATLDNRDALFRPRVLFAPVGEPVAFKNSDPIEHATSLSTNEGVPLCNVAIPPGDERLSPALLSPGLYAATCPLHDWMRATIVATRHPYVETTDKTGRATIDRAPIGDHVAVFWHETLGSTTRRIAVSEGATTTIELKSTDFKLRR